jgi:hypothetical protein
MLKKIADQIQEDISQKNSIKLYFEEKKECDIFPRRLVFLDGVLSIIGEDIHSKALEFFPLSKIIRVEPVDIVFRPNLSQFQVNDFINDLRLVSGKQERLILKFHSQEGADLIPCYHYLHNPYVTSNPEGDVIWAATIEMCEDIFQWLYQMKDQVEILDPGLVRKEFSRYCEFQKAS